MEESPFAARDFVVESVLDYLETEELFTCAEVNRLWQSIALSLLRRKLVSVSVCCTPDSERAALASALGSSHVCVDIFCSKFSRFRNIARMAGLRPSLVFLSHHVDLGEDKRGDVGGCLQRHAEQPAGAAHVPAERGVRVRRRRDRRGVPRTRCSASWRRSSDTSPRCRRWRTRPRSSTWTASTRP
nr:uncharacterized protein LOC129381407 [Dermacentor andersoni]